VRWMHKLLVNRAMLFFGVASSPDVRQIHTARDRNLAGTACHEARTAGAAGAVRLRIGFLALPCGLLHRIARRAEHL